MGTKSPEQAERPVRRCQSDDGAVLVELALVMPFLTLLVLGVLDYGMAWRHESILSSSLRSGVRALAQAQNAATADMLALQAFMGGMSGAKKATVEKVVIYKVTTANTTGTVPSQCLTTSAATAGGYKDSSVNCNVYTGTRLTTGLIADNFGGVSPDYDTNYPPTTRTISLAGSGPDGIGMYAEVKYAGMTSIIPGRTMTLKDSTSGRVEPAAF